MRAHSIAVPNRPIGLLYDSQGMSTWEDRANRTHQRRWVLNQAIEYLGGKCQICGYDKCPEALDFHHVAPSQKAYEISRKVSNLDDMVDELDKCELLCSRCHREVHAGIHPSHLLDSWDVQDPYALGDPLVDLADDGSWVK